MRCIPIRLPLHVHSVGHNRPTRVTLKTFLFSLPSKQVNEIDNEIEQKSIRSPSMRLRFGRRNDPLMSLLNEVSFLCPAAATHTFNNDAQLNASFFYLLHRRRCCTVMNHSVERHSERHPYVFALANATHPWLTMR